MSLLKQLARFAPIQHQQCRNASKMIVQSLCKDTEAITHPTKEYLDSYWENDGKLRPDFKANDFEMWTKGCNKYNLTFIVLKGTKTVIGSNQTVTNISLSGNGEMFMSGGLLWYHEKHRSKERYVNMIKHCLETGYIKNNSTGCMVPGAINFWTKMTGGFNIMLNYYISYYKMSDIQIPTDMHYPNIIIKNGKQCPPEDYVNYDKKVFNYERAQYMICQFNDPDGYSRVAYDSDGNVIGMGALIVYPSGECCITPLYAENAQVAQMIFKSILEEMPLDSDKLWRFQIRSNDKCKDSFEWIEPFIRPKIEKSILSHAVYTHQMPSGLDFSKVFINSHPTNYPI